MPLAGKLALGLGVIIVALILKSVVLALLDPLRRVPGPFWARFTKLWLFRQYIGGKYEQTNIDLHRRYGPIVRIAPSEYSIDSPEAAKIIYGHGSHFIKSDWYEPWGHPKFGNLFNERNNKVHAVMRRQVAMMYSMSSMVSYEPYVNDCTEILCQKLDDFAKSNVSVDMGHWFQCYAFDVIGKITFSKRFGFLDRGEDIRGIMKALEKTSFLSSALGVYSSWWPFVMGAIQTLNRGKATTGAAYISQYSQQETRNRSKETPQDGPEDFVAKLLRAKEQKPDQVTNLTINTTTGANIAAGTDTTMISLSSVLYNLCRNPAAMEKLQNELDAHAASGAISDPITFQEAQKLPYLQAVIKESLRIHPATGFTMPRVVPPGGRVMAGKFFPENTVVGVNSWVAHHNREVFGPDADDFVPERWLRKSNDEQQEVEDKMESYLFTFGQGARTCIGKNISLLEMSKAVPQVLRKFSFSLESEGQWTTKNHWFVKPVGFKCRVELRRK